MSDVRIRGLTKRWHGKPPTTAVDDLDLDVEAGEFLVLLGPSGCGKTTTLRCIAGLETANTGEIHFGDNVVFDAARKVNVPPNKRNIGMVFQSYALWPHMTVRKNIGYPLKARRVEKATARNWVEETAALVDCEPLLERYPGQLSGGQQQRVALARGLVARPELVLFDEPLSNLDARLRDQVRTEIHELHGRLGFTAVYVTHDQSEALALGDRLAIMRTGEIEQLATPEEVFEEPATEYVAGFIGMSNRFCSTSRRSWRLPQRPPARRAPLDRPRARLDYDRPRAAHEDVRLDSPEDASRRKAGSAFPATVIDSSSAGSSCTSSSTVGETRMRVQHRSGRARQLGAAHSTPARTSGCRSTRFEPGSSTEDGARVAVSRRRRQRRRELAP